jgi:hypothetical protein
MLLLDESYEAVEMDHVDLKKTETGAQGDESFTHYDRMLRYHFNGPELTSLFLRTLDKVKNEDPNVDYSFVSENQQGIGAVDRELNPYLADQLHPMTHANGALGQIMYNHGITNTNYASKISKWGNSSCPILETRPNMSKKERQEIKNKNKVIRKRFFVFYIMDLLERQKNYRLLSKLSQMSLDDRSHLCDAMAQGMRFLLTSVWSKLEQLTRLFGSQSPVKLPTNTLPKDVFDRVIGRMGKITVPETAKIKTTKGVKKGKKGPRAKRPQV